MNSKVSAGCIGWIIGVTGHNVVRIEIKKLILVMHWEKRFHLVPFLLPFCCLPLPHDYL